MSHSERRLIAVQGVVQGVGFRPFVHRLAVASRLGGTVRNGGAGVLIDVQGEPANLDGFCRSLTAELPTLASIESIGIEAAPPLAASGFRIAASERAVPPASIPSLPPDVATCERCLGELFDPGNRRFGHPFISCTDCGPRFTIVLDAPYDRERTTMATFAMCAPCRSEYEDPADRRFHAEAIACPDCGPMLRLVRPGDAGARSETLDDVSGAHALTHAVEAIRRGAIVAVKALGGYQLACDATSEEAVARLRARKHRLAKPFALMVRDLAMCESLCEVDSGQRAMLISAERPIVLLACRTGAAVADCVAPGQRTLGVMLPSTPLHYLLLAAAERPLVMTSGNRTGDPVAIDDATALDTLGDIADVFLVNDRAIVARCDDSVMQHSAGAVRVIRRARGLAPRAIPLAVRSRATVLAVGGHLKNTACVVRGDRALLSAHVGDLDGAEARGALRAAIAQLLRATASAPAIVAHDLHPEYASTRIAESLGIADRIAVQHHHAHVAACVAEHRVRGPVIGVAFDGAGLGTDGAIWGGEFLHVDGARFTRLGHLAYVPLPGGDAAARAPWRSAAAHLAHAARRTGTAAGALDAARPAEVGDAEWSLVQQLLVRDGAAMPRTSSVGRLFDAVASLLGLCHISRFEGEAAMSLEGTADPRARSRYVMPLSDDVVWTADPSPLIHAVIEDRARDTGVGMIAGAFHLALAELVVQGCVRAREQTGTSAVVLGGGVFVNQLLLELCLAALAAERFEVHAPRLAPCNDGGLSLGQAYVAACALED